jgi:hypothetical protein
LIAARQYPKAVSILRAQHQADQENVWIRQQLADVLVMNGQRDEALEVLDGLVDTFVQGGFHQKAVAVVKKMQRLAPEDPANEERLTFIVRSQEKEMGKGTQRPGGGGRGAIPVTPEEAERAAKFQAALKPPTATRFALQADQSGVAASSTPARQGAPARAPEPKSPAHSKPPQEEIVIEVVEEQGPAGPGAELKGLARSPLFGQFSPADLLAVIRGLSLKTCEPGEILVSEGEPGSSLFVLVSGFARVFVRDATRRNRQIRTLQEGEFFGEVSLVTGQPRSATVTAAAPCELLELDQATLKAIAADHPQVPLVIREICDRRAGSSEELAARGASQPDA